MRRLCVGCACRTSASRKGISMVDYQTAVAAVQDPQADPILLAKIAYENPEFGANVAVHPRAYPGLKRWLAEFGDPNWARMTLAQMGVIATADPCRRPLRRVGDPVWTAEPRTGARRETRRGTTGAQFGRAATQCRRAPRDSPSQRNLRRRHSTRWRRSLIGQRRAIRMRSTVRMANSRRSWP